MPDLAVHVISSRYWPFVPTFNLGSWVASILRANIEQAQRFKIGVAANAARKLDINHDRSCPVSRGKGRDSKRRI